MVVMRIVIVEDEIIFACDLKNRLERLGHEVIGVFDKGHTALEKIVTNHPDLVLMDICIRGNMDGIQVTKEINKFSEIPVIYMTAYNDDSTRKKIDKTNYFDIMSKPINAVALEKMIEELHLTN